jgi:hypothetical protein
MNIFTKDSVIGFTYKPYAETFEKGREYNALYQINSHGLRDREYGPNSNDIFRILLLGDSFSVSHGLAIEDSLARQLEKALQTLIDTDGTPLDIEVINGAAGGYSPYNYWKAYQRWSPVLRPDAVIVGLSPDDYDSNNAGLNYIIENGEVVGVYRDGQKPHKVKKGTIRKIRKWMSWNSQFYILLRNYFYYNDFVGRVSRIISTKKQIEEKQFGQFIVPQKKEMVDSWNKSFSYLEKLHVNTIKDGVDLIIIPIPLKEEIDVNAQRRVITASGLIIEKIDMNQTLKMVLAFCNARNIHVLDPRPALKIRHMRAPCYFVYDGHWNEEGVRTATKYLATQWRKLGIRPWKKNRKETKL